MKLTKLPIPNEIKTNSNHFFSLFQLGKKGGKFQMYLYILPSSFEPTYSKTSFRVRRMWKWKKRHVIQMVFFTLKRFWFQQSLKTCRSPNHHLQVTVGLLNIFFCHWYGSGSFIQTKSTDSEPTDALKKL